MYINIYMYAQNLNKTYFVYVCCLYVYGVV